MLLEVSAAAAMPLATRSIEHGTFHRVSDIPTLSVNGNVKSPLQCRLVVTSTLFFQGYPGDLGNFRRALDFCVCHGPGYPGDLALGDGFGIAFCTLLFFLTFWEPISCTLLFSLSSYISCTFYVFDFVGATGPRRYLIFCVVKFRVISNYNHVWGPPGAEI